MKIETKLNVNDQVFFISNAKVCSSVIRKIDVLTDGEVTDITYLCNEKEDKQNVHLKVKEEHAFKSKKLLIESL